MTQDRSAAGSIRQAVFDLKAEVSDHLMGFGSFLSRGRQVAVHENRVCRVERHGPERAKVELAPAADTKLFVGIDEAEQAKNLETALGR